MENISSISLDLGPFAFTKLKTGDYSSWRIFSWILFLNILIFSSPQPLGHSPWLTAPGTFPPSSEGNTCPDQGTPRSLSPSPQPKKHPQHFWPGPRSAQPSPCLPHSLLVRASTAGWGMWWHCSVTCSEWCLWHQSHVLTPHPDSPGQHWIMLWTQPSLQKSWNNSFPLSGLVQF